MPLTLADVAPLMRGHYVDRKTMWSTLERLGTLIIDRALRLAPPDDRRGFAIEVLADLGRAILRRKGLAFEGEAPADYTGWLITNVRRAAFDMLRRLRKKAVRADLPEQLVEESTPAEEPGVRHEGEAPRRAADVWERLRASDCPPAYRLALFAWYWPLQLTRDDLVSLSQQVERGKVEQRSGLLRPVEHAWPLTRELFCRLGKSREKGHQRSGEMGLQRNGKAQSAFAWIVRSDAPRYSAWAEDRKAERAARETIGKWHVRGRKWLEQRATPEGGAA